MKKGRVKKKIVWLLATILTVTGVANIGAMSEVGAAEMIAAKSINMKQSDNTIAGIDAPISTDNTATEWQGDYIYYGSYSGSSVKFRVLSPCEVNYGDTTLLLDSDAVLAQMKYKDSYSDVRWSSSDLKTWLNGTGNGQFLEEFSTTEQSAIIDSTKSSVIGAGDFPSEKYVYVALTGEKIFALDASEANHSGYGYANDDTRIKQGGIYEWWLRSTNPMVTDAICTVYSDGNIYNYYFPNYEKVGASPALNIDLDAVLLTSPYNQEKATTFASVDEITTNEWRLTLKATDEELRAETNSDTIFYVDKETKNERSLVVTHRVATTVFSDATQVSAMLTDVTGNVLYYGKVNDAFASESTIEIPDTLSIGNYNLYVFAEEVNATTMTDYACSLGTPISITVQSKEDVTKNKVTVVNGHGSGTYETGVIVEIRANMAKAGMQFLKWEVTEGNVTLANETSPITSFPMPEDAVTVTAVYEDISETSDTGEHLKIIWIGLLVVAIFLAVILLIVRKRLIKEW